MNRKSISLPLSPIAMAILVAGPLALAPAFAQSPGSTQTAPTGTVPEINRAAPSPPTTPVTTAPPQAAIVPPVPGAASLAVNHQPRASQLVGTKVHNDLGETVGEVDDIILSSAVLGAQAPVAVIQVGGFLGIGGRLVTVPLNDLQWNAERERVVLPNATKDSLQGRPAFSYDTLQRS